MITYKKYLAIALAFVCVFSATPAIAVPWTSPWDYQIPKESINIGFVESDDSPQISDRITIKKIQNDFAESHMCTDGAWGDSCRQYTKSGFSYQGRSILEVCPTENSENCVVGLKFNKADGTEVAASFVGYASGDEYEGDAKTNLRKASKISLWKAEGANHAGGVATYMVKVTDLQTYNYDKIRFISNSIDISLIPYTEARGPQYKAQYMAEEKRFNGTRNWVHQFNSDYGCVWTDTGVCGVRQDFAEGITPVLTVRVTKEIKGWFSGRAKNPVLDVKSFSETNNELVIQAEAASVARFGAIATKNNSSVNAIAKLNPGKQPLEKVFYGGNHYLNSDGGIDKNSFPILEEYRSLAEDKAVGTNTFWNLHSLTGKGFGNPCLESSSKLLGVVSTNATVFDGGIPRFKNGYLNYQVASVHYLTDGETLNEGTYDMYVRSDVARCLYGFSKAPLSATVSVINDKGSKTTATTVVSEKNGWLKLAAYGFTFSKKTIKVKISKKK